MRIDGLVLGKYRIEKLISNGAFASVFRAKEEFTNRTVAIKALPRAIYAADRMRYLLTELSAMALNWGHPNIVSIHTVEPGDDEYVNYIVMEYVPGEDLRHMMAVKLPTVGLAINIALDICRGLRTAHENNIIHRDIKPQNILLTDDFTAKISDFGVARILATANEYAGTITGTRKYMAPEQYQGVYDFRADLYSTGLILYEMLVGRFPFRGENHDAIQMKKRRAEVEFDSEFPDDLARFLRKALHSDVKARYQKASEMYEDLDRIRKDRYAAAVRQAIINDSGEMPHATLSGDREDLRLSSEAAELIEVQVLYEQQVEMRRRKQREIEICVDAHYNQAIEAIKSSQTEQALLELQQAHRLYLSDTLSTKKAEWIFRGLSDTITSSATPATAKEIIESLSQAPLDEIMKLKAWCDNQFPPNEPLEHSSDWGSDTHETDDSSRVSLETQIVKAEEPPPELILQRLHKIVHNPHEVIAEQIRQTAETYAHQQKDRRARAEYKKLAQFYKRSAVEFSMSSEWALVADCYMRARFAYAAGGRHNSARKSAEAAGFYYAELATQLEAQQEWEEAGKLYTFSAEHYACARQQEIADESRSRATVCYFNVAENEYAAGNLLRAYEHCEKTLALAAEMLRASKAVTGARKLINEIAQGFGTASERDSRFDR